MERPYIISIIIPFDDASEKRVKDYSILAFVII